MPHRRDKPLVTEKDELKIRSGSPKGVEEPWSNDEALSGIAKNDPLAVIQESIKTAEQDLAAIDDQLEKYALAHTELQEARTQCAVRLEIAENKLGSSLIAMFRPTVEQKAVRLEVDMAREALSDATEKLRDAEESSQQAREYNLSTKNDINATLRTLREQEAKIKAGGIVMLNEHLGTYSTDIKMTDVQPILSRYEKDIAEVTIELESLKRTQAYWEKNIEKLRRLQAESDSAESALSRVTKDKGIVSNKQITFEKQLSDLVTELQAATKLHQEKKEKLANQNLLKRTGIKVARQIMDLDILGFKILGLITRILRTKHAERTDRKRVIESHPEKIENMKTLLNLATMYGNTIDNMIAIQEKTLQSMQAELNTIPEPEHNKIHDLETKIVSARNKNKERLSLIAQCVPDTSLGILRDKESASSIQVKKSLSNFLENPSTALLSVLTQTMIDNPDYSTNQNVITLLEKSRNFFPEIPILTSEQLCIDPKKIVHVLSDEISRLAYTSNNLLNDKLALIEEHASLIETKDLMSPCVAANKKALLLAVRMLFLVEQLQIAQNTEKQSNTSATHGDKKAAQNMSTLLKTIISKIENNLPNTEINAVREMTNNILFRTGAGTVLNFNESKDEIVLLLASYVTENNQLPTEINITTLEKFRSGMDDAEDGRELWANIMALPVIKKQIDENQTLVNMVEQFTQEMDTVALFDRIYQVMEDISHKIELIDRVRKDTNNLKEDVALMVKKDVDSTTIHGYIEEHTDALTERAWLIPYFTDTDVAKNFCDQFRALEGKNGVTKDELLTYFKTGITSVHPSIQGECHQAIIDIIQDINLVFDPAQLSEKIQWIDEPELKVYSTEQIAAQEQQIMLEIKAIDHQVSELGMSIQALQTKIEQVHLNDINVTDVIIADKINDLINACGNKILFQYGEPVRLALKQFLSNPTPENGEHLKHRMKDNSNYVQNETLVSLITRAGEYFPLVINAHKNNKQMLLAETASYKKQLMEENIPNSAPADSNVPPKPNFK